MGEGGKREEGRERGRKRGREEGRKEGREGGREELETVPATDLEVSHGLSLGILWVPRALASEEGKGLGQVSEAVEVLLKLSAIYLHWGREGRR